MTVNDFPALLAGNDILIIAVQLLATVWLKARLEGAIRHEYDQRLEAYRRELDRRDRAAMVAELFAEWTSCPEDTKRLNQLAWEATLWLPANVVKEVMKRLSNDTEARDVKEILVDIRKYLAPDDCSISADAIVHFHKRTT